MSGLMDMLSAVSHFRTCVVSQSKVTCRTEKRQERPKRDSPAALQFNFGSIP